MFGTFEEGTLFFQLELWRGYALSPDLSAAIWPPTLENIPAMDTTQREAEPRDGKAPKKAQGQNFSHRAN